MHNCVIVGAQRQSESRSVATGAIDRDHEEAAFPIDEACDPVAEIIVDHRVILSESVACRADLGFDRELAD